MRECFRCGKEYDERSFLVKLKTTKRTYLSSLCEECAKEDPDVEIIPQKKVEKTRNEKAS